MRRFLPLLIFFYVSVTSCNKQSTSITSPYAYFPNEVGDHWRYLFYYTPTQTYYHDVDVVGTRTLANGEVAKIWISRWPGLSNTDDSSFVFSNDTIVKFYVKGCPTCYTPTLENVYRIPFQLGNFWLGPVFHDTTRVLTNSTIDIPGGIFENTFAVWRKVPYILNYFVNDTMWLTPHVGMTRLNQNEYNLGPYGSNGIHELLNYTLH